MLNQLLLTQNVQISIVFLSVKSIIMNIKEWHHVSLTSNISGKTWSNCTCRGCFENVRTSRFQICPWFWKLTKICVSNRVKQNIELFVPVLYYYYLEYQDYIQIYHLRHWMDTFLVFELLMNDNQILQWVTDRRSFASDWNFTWFASAAENRGRDISAMYVCVWNEMWKWIGNYTKSLYAKSLFPASSLIYLKYRYIL